MKNPFRFSPSLLAAVILGTAANAVSKPIPAALPDPDGQPGDATKPVQVYILAGQSNMVGMGNLSGAKNFYDGVYLSSDPEVPDGPVQIYKAGNFKVSPLDVYLPDGAAAEQPIAEGLLQVPKHGVYRFHCGTGETSANTMQVDGKEVYRREAEGKPVKQEMTLEPGKRYAFEISDFSGGAPRFWLEKVDLLGNGDLEAVAKREGKFPWLVDGDGEWTVRNDVYFQEARLAADGKGSPLSPSSNNGKSIGPELGFGHVLGEFHGEQVLLIKTAQGNRSLGFDFRPPSSGRTDPDNEFESAEYRLMVEGVRKTLANIDKVVPNYMGQGYEIAGFAWFQGHKDSGTEESSAEYEKHLVNLINDVRKEFEVPELPTVVATIGFGGQRMQEKYLGIHEAQMAVGDAEKHPGYAGNVASVDTRDFWREVDESPKGEDYHYNRNAETYMLIGDAIGRTMVSLLGGEAEALPATPRPRRAEPQEVAERTAQQQAADRAALRPVILDGIAAAYAADARNNQSLVDEASGTPPQRPNQFLRGSMFGLINCYNAAGVDDYDWHVFGEDLRDAEWEYFTFDAAEPLPKENGYRFRKVAYPAGMENWASAGFDAAKAGWKKGRQPFGQLDGKLAPLRTCDRAGGCGCGEKPRTLWDREVILMRGNFEIPPLQDGHRYRIVIGGSNHVNTGEGYAIYLDGKPLAESATGVPNRQGGQPRGAHVYSEFLDTLEDGEVTIAVTSFLQYHKRGAPTPPSGHLTVWIEEQKIPVVEKVAAGGS
ncbi:MAG: sialate O-acetylesterase [Verrucomicrobiales bacterium]